MVVYVGLSREKNVAISVRIPFQISELQPKLSSGSLMLVKGL